MPFTFASNLQYVHIHVHVYPCPSCIRLSNMQVETTFYLGNTFNYELIQINRLLKY